MKRRILASLLLSATVLSGVAKSNSGDAYVAATDKSIVKAQGVNIGDVEWTDGFWKERFDMVMPNLIPAQYEYFMGFSEDNFRKLAGDMEMGDGFKGTFWQDGDYYKWLEAQVAVYSVTKDPKLQKQINQKAEYIAKSIAEDGYSTTHTQIGYGVTGSERAWNKPFKNDVRFKSTGMHETYNMGHLLTLACTHYRVTGDRTLLDAAIKVGDFLDKYFAKVTPELSDVDFNPTQIMGIMELYRTTGEERYLNLANRFITGRGHNKGKTQNQNDTKLRDETRAVGHAVLGPVLYIGAADYAAETNDEELIVALKNIWDDIYTRKASFTGGLGNVHRGGSETPRNATECVHEAFGKPYHIQSATAYNETCATYYGAYYSWRLFMLTGETKYLDTMEKAFYNNLSAMQLDGKSYYYTNVLRWYGEDHNCLSLDFHQRWTEECTCVCCPTSVVRFLAESKEYAYAKDDNSIFVTLYGSNSIDTKLNGKSVKFSQQSDYPWSEDVVMTYSGDKKNNFALKLRIPQWAEGATLKVNGVDMPISGTGLFAVVDRTWNKGDKVELTLPMKPVITEANPMVEEVRNQVAVSYGPLTYCVEGKDLPKGVTIDNILLPIDTKFDVKFEEDLLGGVKTISADALVRKSSFDKSGLYAPIKGGYEEFKLKLIPYYTWSNRGEYEMSVFVPVKW
ncbi:MAG: beta-L-arabinofuranosidase domain-containing protein [Rikenellaceae bacterium]